ncbi:MAG: S4 domain-containing protein [Betaproteobacteria bacterium]
MPTHRERHAKRATEAAKSENSGAAQHGVRLDKWLWAARFFKTRALAQEAIESGKVRREGAPCKPSHTVRVHDTYAIVRDGLAWNIVVVALAEQRGSAALAAQLYGEAEASVAARLEQIEQRKLAMANAPQFKGRPTKRQRRKIEDFLAEP